MARAYNEVLLTNFLDQVFWRLRLIEAQLALTARQLGMPHQGADSMTPAEVTDLLVRATEPGATPGRPTEARRHPPRTSTPAAAAA
jgi:hypothetical protein